MDHRISKDMISSGMTPSGEKSQADLGRTQYGSAPTPSSLMDAYKSIYEHHQKDKDGNTIPHEDEQLNEGLATAAGGTIGYKKGGVKGAIVGGTAGAIIDKMGKKKNPQVKEDKEQVNEILGMAAGALGAKMVGGAAAKMAAKGAMKKAVASGLTKTAAGKAAAKTAAMKAGQAAGMKAGTSAAINYGTAGSIAGAGLKSASNVLSGNPVQKRTMSAGVDLFDIVKGKLLDEGLTEEESMDVMLTLTLDEINEVIKLDEVSSELLMKAAKGAEVARGKAAVAGDKVGAVKKMKQGEKFYKGAVEKRKASGQMGAGYKESK